MSSRTAFFRFYEELTTLAGDPRILAFTPVAAVLTVTPGADTLLVLRNVLRGGRKEGLDRMRRFIVDRGVRRWLDGICGALLMGLGIRLALEKA